jgi:hypothetical protein
MHFDSFSLGARHLFQKYVFPFEKKYFDRLVLKPLDLYVNLLSRFVAY